MKNFVFMLVAIFTCSMAQAQTESEAFNAIINSMPALNEEFKEESLGPVTIYLSYDAANKAIIYTYTTHDKDTFDGFVLGKESVAVGVMQGIFQSYAQDGLLNDFLDEYEKYGFKYIIRTVYPISIEKGARQVEVTIDAKKARKIAKQLGY